MTQSFLSLETLKNASTFSYSAFGPQCEHLSPLVVTVALIISWNFFNTDGLFVSQNLLILRLCRDVYLSTCVEYWVSMIVLMISFKGTRKEMLLASFRLRPAFRQGRLDKTRELFRLNSYHRATHLTEMFVFWKQGPKPWLSLEILSRLIDLYILLV